MSTNGPNTPGESIPKRRRKLPPPTGKAIAALKEKPLQITAEEAAWLAKATKASFVKQLNNLYANAKPGDGKTKFTDLPPAAQTAVFSAAWQHGTSGLDEVPGFKEAALQRNWSGVASSLDRMADKKGLYGERRKKEAGYLYQGLMGGVDQP